MNKPHRWVAHVGGPCKVQRNEDGQFSCRLPPFQDSRMQLIRIECIDCGREVSEVWGEICEGEYDANYPTLLWSGL